jgi:outer membrane lipoprotein-sorting protein
MKPYCKFYLFIIAILFLLSSFLLEDWKLMKDVNTFKTKLNQININTQSIQCDFIQVKTLSFVKDKLTSKGKMWYKKPYQIRLSYTSPFIYDMVIQQGQVTINDKGKISKYDVNKSKLFKSINNLMINAMRGDVLNNPMFMYQYFENQSMNRVDMIVTDANLKTYIKNVKVYINKESYQVDKLEMFEPSGDQTNITFSNRKINETLPKDIFIITK